MIKKKKRKDDNRNDNKSDSEDVRGNENVVYISERGSVKYKIIKNIDNVRSKDIDKELYYKS